jgi:transposase
VTRTLAKRGKTPVLEWPWTKSVISVIGAVTLDGRIFFHAQDEGIKSPSVVHFLKLLMAKIPGRLTIIWDRGRIHLGAVTTFLKALETGRIKIEQLPGYAPDLNPEEGVWHLLKDVELKNVCRRSLLGLMREFRLATVRLPHKKKQILACFKKARLKI